VISFYFRWDDTKLAEVRNLKAKLEEELQHLRSTRDWQMEEMKLDSQLTQFINQLRNFESSLISSQQIFEEKQTQLNRVLKEQSSTQAELQTIGDEVNIRQQALDRVKTQIDEIADRLVIKNSLFLMLMFIREFRDFSARIGVQNYREYEELHLKKAKENSEKRKDFEVQISRMKWQLEYETSRDLKTPIQELKETLKTETKKLKTLQKEAQKKTQTQMHFKDEIEGSVKEYQELEKLVKTKEIEITELKNIDDEHLHSIRELETTLASRKAKTQHLSEEKNELFQVTIISWLTYCTW